MYKWIRIWNIRKEKKLERFSKIRMDWDDQISYLGRAPFCQNVVKVRFLFFFLNWSIICIWFRYQSIAQLLREMNVKCKTVSSNSTNELFFNFQTQRLTSEITVALIQLAMKSLQLYMYCFNSNNIDEAVSFILDMGRI